MSAIEKVFRSGETIISEGHEANALYVIRKGKVDVLKRGSGGEQVLVSQLGQGEFFGEMSLLDPEHSIHSATVRAAEETTVMITERRDFDRYLGNMTPGMQKLLGHLVRKLRETTDKYCKTRNELDKKQDGTK